MEPSDVDIWRIQLDRVDIDLSVLSSPEMQKANRCLTESHRHRYRATRFCLRSILACYLPITADNVELEKSANGKPSIPDSPIEFNLTHSGPLALLAITSGKLIGIDIEPIRKRNNVAAIAKRVLSNEIVGRLNRTSDETEKALLFTRVWTAFEARQKMTGNGIFGSSNTPVHQLLRIHPFDEWIAAIAVEGEKQDTPPRFFDFPTIS